MINQKKYVHFVTMYIIIFSLWIFLIPKNLFKIFLIKLLHLPISNSVCYFQVFVHS
ncbi:DUF4084 domain-containing protein, partial [Bacillus thuringiensis]